MKAVRLVTLAALLVLGGTGAAAPPRQADWPVYGGDPGGQRLTPLTQIDRRNVGQLAEVWRFETGAGQLQTSPLVIDGVLYGATPEQSVFALDAATGRELWRFTPPQRGFQPVRGLTWWSDGTTRRLFAANAHYLTALDPATGRPAPEFGQGGRIDLREGLGRDPQGQAVFMTSPGMVHGDLIITGFRTGEGLPAAPGAVRAYDVRSGALRWTFNLIPRAGQPGSETWPAGASQTAGGANNWAGMTLDAARGIVYVPTGSAGPDFFGGERHGANLYANSLVALDAATGRYLWHFQTTHHDVLDRDLPAPPSLLTVRRGGRRIDAVLQASKQGLLFLFDRTTGAPLFEIEERPVPQSDVPGEQTAPSQPFPVLPAPIARQTLTEEDLTRRTPEAHTAVLARFRQLRSGGPYQPLGTGARTVVFPGFDGGAEWGGAAVDPQRGIAYLNANDVPWLGGLAETTASSAASPGEAVYVEHCAACHGADRAGAPPEFPALTALAERLTREDVAAVLAEGKGRMPGFPQLGAAARTALIDHLLAVDPAEARRRLEAAGMTREMMAEFSTLLGAERQRYTFTGYAKFTDPDGYPAVAPPWGTLNAVDLNTGRTLWRVPLGEYPELVAQGLTATGSENYGGPLLTRSGLLFIGATIYDRKFRAFDAANGSLLWQTVLPYAGTATPISYAVGGRQFVVIATSGGRNPRGLQGSAYVAFALPQRARR
jgi:quinoprotein glucose dehydrogenase